MSWIDQHDDMAGAFAAVAEAKTVEDKLFRDAMSRLGAAVHVITTDGPAGKTGFTATAVCSVSDCPATLLMCLNRSATSMPILRGNGVFCVNTLARRRGDHRRHVRRPHQGRARGALRQPDTGPRSRPARRCCCRAVVAFDCRVIEVKSVASHDVYFGIVEAIHAGPPGAALVYHDRAYKQV